jgi:hypothetical protein
MTVDQFCVQGGYLEMNVIGYCHIKGDKDDKLEEEKEGERGMEMQEACKMDPVHLIHLVSF